MLFDFKFALSLVPDILSASVVTAYVSLLGCFFAVLIGVMLALARRGGRVVSGVAYGVIETGRLSPFLPQLYFAYFVLPAYGIVLPAILIGIIALAFHFGCFLAIVFGAGIDAVPKGQKEAARSLGLKPGPIALLIVLPQAIRVVIAPTANYFIVLLKTTPYLAIIGVPEMLGVAFDQASNSFRYVEPLTVVGALFLGYCLTIGHLVRLLEKYLEGSLHRPVR